MRALTVTSLAVLALAACERAEPARAPEPAAAAPSAQPAAPAQSWTLQITGAGAALVATADGAEALRLACARDPDELVVTVPGFKSVESEEQLSVGVDDEPFLLVARPGALPAGVEARGPIPADLLNRIEAAREVRAVYGYQTLGPLAPPDAATARRFADACREVLK